jgi:hypothetical protein
MGTDDDGGESQEPGETQNGVVNKMEEEELKKDEENKNKVKEKQKQDLEKRQKGLKMRVGKQRLIIPLRLELSVDEKEIVMNNMAVFEQNGFDLQFVLRKGKKDSERPKIFEVGKEKVELMNECKNLKRICKKVINFTEMSELEMCEEDAIGVEEEEGDEAGNLDGVMDGKLHENANDNICEEDEKNGPIDATNGNIFLVSIPMFSGSALQLGVDGIF